jgi:hypothetical protein
MRKLQDIFSPELFIDACRLIDLSSHAVIVKSDAAWTRGDFRYIVTPNADTSLWLESFFSKKEAKTFCSKMGWKYALDTTVISRS